MECFASKVSKSTLPITPVTAAALDDALMERGRTAVEWARVNAFAAKPGSVLLLPDATGAATEALLGVEAEASAPDIWSWGAAAERLPTGRYALLESGEPAAAEAAALGWALGCYRFRRYRKSQDEGVSRLVLPASVDRKAVQGRVEALWLVRDLINTPASDMGPGELASAAHKLAREFKGRCRVITGDDLLQENLPMIHAVGRASARAPRLIDMTWGRARDPKVTLIGKGVCFDSGGLDLKPANNMLLMKKDMGGAAQVLGLARMIMAAGLRVRLRVLVPAVENSVSGDAFRPLDVLSTRKGITVEIGNTDAEGRLVLADALTLAGEDKPDLILDYATLTGAARVAVGTEIAAMFANDDTLATEFSDSAAAVGDPVWRLPLHRDYRRLLDSKVADISNTGTSGFAGAITAALFLQEFVPEGVPWAHFDIMAWNSSARPGRPEGGEAMAVRAAFETIRRRFG